MTENNDTAAAGPRNNDKVIIENLTRQVHNYKSQVETLKNQLNGLKQRTCDILLNVDEEKARMKVEIETRDSILVQIANQLGVEVPSMPNIQSKIEELRSAFVEAAALREKLKKFAAQKADNIKSIVKSADTEKRDG